MIYSTTYLHDVGADKVNVTRRPGGDDRHIVIGFAHGPTEAGVYWYSTPEQVRAVLAEIGRQVDALVGAVPSPAEVDQ